MSAWRELCVWLAAALLAGCASAGARDPDAASVTFGSPGATLAPQRVALAVDDGDPRTPPIQVAGTVPAGSTEFGVAMSLSNLLLERGCQATWGSGTVPGYDLNVQLRLPSDTASRTSPSRR